MTENASLRCWGSCIRHTLHSASSRKNCPDTGSWGKDRAAVRRLSIILNEGRTLQAITTSHPGSTWPHTHKERILIVNATDKTCYSLQHLSRDITKTNTDEKEITGAAWVRGGQLGRADGGHDLSSQENQAKPELRQKEEQVETK